MVPLWLTALAVAALAGLVLRRRRRLPADGRVVYIIGADTGFGFSSAQHLQRAGCRVLAGCLHADGEGARLLGQAGCQVIPVDVRDPDSVTAAAAEAARLAGDARLWAVIYNAGVLVLGHVAWLTEHQARHMFDVNVLGAVRAARASLPALARPGGRLLLVGSPCGSIPCQEVAVYAASKAALAALAAGLQMEVRASGLHVALVTPGDMATSTNILGRQAEHVQLMWQHMDADTRRRDGAVFAAFRARLAGLGPRPPAVLGTPRLRRAVLRAVLDVSPLRHYTAVELGTQLWLALSWLLPRRLQEWLVDARLHYALHRLDWDWLDLNNLI
ncbi:Estradiol 17-beta-dehydrogenase 2 [Amphibalanus amphitrite]|uniref:Estradiol 17-beta-dehydrogenase 2 n=1 Tax=Amphibalanus amphitrite TaxID=1232801 RepID=A0A6A4VZU3_AMPAM|nr:estradiol 17-beta-dehydrogenase 2-like [Amphibalanus amphitrite]KAF0298449.1 Estradiol 17-beta-dehydrogenase 2 [Amphibalanus amphitrite]